MLNLRTKALSTIGKIVLTGSGLVAKVLSSTETSSDTSDVQNSPESTVYDDTLGTLETSLPENVTLYEKDEADSVVPDLDSTPDFVLSGPPGKRALIRVVTDESTLDADKSSLSSDLDGMRKRGYKTCIVTSDLLEDAAVNYGSESEKKVHVFTPTSIADLF